jgi:hypothetical protein
MFFLASLKDEVSENNDVNKAPLRNTEGGYITTNNSFKYVWDLPTHPTHTKT